MSIKVNQGKMEAQARVIAERLRRRVLARLASKERELREIGRAAAVELANETFPLGGDEPSAKALAAVAADIKRVFITVPEVYAMLRAQSGPARAKAFFRAVQAGDLNSARRQMRRGGGVLAHLDFGPVSPAVHESARSGPSRRVTARRPLRIVAVDEREAYIRKVQGELGKAAAGWASAASELGGEDGIPHWKSTSVHGSGGGGGSFHKSDMGVYVRINNSVAYIRKNLQPGKVRAVARKARAKVLELLRRG